MTDEFDDDAPLPIPDDCPYTLRRVRFAGGWETPRFEAHLLRDGVHVATVANGGTGSCHDYHPTLAGGWRAVREFEAYGEAWGAPLGIRHEPHDALIYELLEHWWSTQPIYR